MQGREKEQFGLFGTTPLDQVLAPSISARTESYEASMKRRFIVEGANSWIKDEGMRQTKLRGTQKVDWELHLMCSAYSLRKHFLKGG